ncbi:MAG: hypothetical protein Phog2KO_03490 [Phototrophicaceae bacterium]
MQAPRNWRMKEERYRLTGSENNQGNTSLVNRPPSLATKITKKTDELEQPEPIKINVA